MPKSPITRRHADEAGRLARIAVAGLGKAVTVVSGFVAEVARYTARGIVAAWRTVEDVPPAVKLFVAAGVLMLVGVVGAISLENSWGLTCIVVVIPVCASILGALGHRWYSGQGAGAARPAATSPANASEPAPSELARSVHYVDKKLALALGSFGTEHHQQAMIALFQAKTAVELTLGTEQDTAEAIDLPLTTAEYSPRPRIRAGSTSMLRESNSLAAS
ncbi:hypothetical protein [Mycolicibacterium palauense]|uniref:hypothetical protein n=1 Tax=Mycolicibacterium palauense TaxID=2034511 RepID=UPI000BFECAC7|nr:hypothetical protein [Mycolicibacterium palauense]